MTDEEFRATVRDGVVTHSRQALAEDKWKDFAPHLFYLSGGNDDPHTYARLKARAEEIERNIQLPGNRIFYLSIPPSSFAPVCEGLEQAGLATKPRRRIRPTPASSSKNRSAAIWPPPRPSTT